MASPGSMSDPDVDPLVAAAGIRHGLDDAHVTDADFEIRLGLDAALRFYRGDEIVLNVPAAFELRRYFHWVQGAIADAANADRIGTEIVGHGAGIAIDFESIAGGERVN